MLFYLECFYLKCFFLYFLLYISNIRIFQFYIFADLFCFLIQLNEKNYTFSIKLNTFHYDNANGLKLWMFYYLFGFLWANFRLIVCDSYKLSIFSMFTHVIYSKMNVLIPHYFIDWFIIEQFHLRFDHVFDETIFYHDIVNVFNFLLIKTSFVKPSSLSTKFLITCRFRFAMKYQVI